MNNIKIYIKYFEDHTHVVEKIYADNKLISEYNPAIKRTDLSVLKKYTGNNVEVFSIYDRNETKNKCELMLLSEVSKHERIGWVIRLDNIND
jgi:hypothetical protein